MAMEISEKLMKFKFHLIIFASVSLLIFFLIKFAPSFVGVVSFFWPLLVSTAMFLVAVVVFGRIHPPPSEASGEKTGEGLLDYVAGQPDGVVHEYREE